MLPSKDRIKAWNRIVIDLPATLLDGITAQTVRLEEVGAAAEAMLAGELRGRVLVDVN
jgi:acrylyl-CoA reductase (NADPH)